MKFANRLVSVILYINVVFFVDSFCSRNFWKSKKSRASRNTSLFESGAFYLMKKGSLQGTWCSQP